MLMEVSVTWTTKSFTAIPFSVFLKELKRIFFKNLLSAFGWFVSCVLCSSRNCESLWGDGEKKASDFMIREKTFLFLRHFFTHQITKIKNKFFFLLFDITRYFFISFAHGFSPLIDTNEFKKCFSFFFQ